MRARTIFTVATLLVAGTMMAGQGARRLNPMIELLSQNKPVFGLYAPSNPRARSAATVRLPGGAARTPPYVPPVSTAAPPSPPKTAAQLAQDALARRFEPWRQRHSQLSRELRDQPYLLTPPSPASSIM